MYPAIIVFNRGEGLFRIGYDDPLYDNPFIIECTIDDKDEILDQLWAKYRFMA